VNLPLGNNMGYAKVEIGNLTHRATSTEQEYKVRAAGEKLSQGSSKEPGTLVRNEEKKTAKTLLGVERKKIRSTHWIEKGVNRGLRSANHVQGPNARGLRRLPEGDSSKGLRRKTASKEKREKVA